MKPLTTILFTLLLTCLSAQAADSQVDLYVFHNDLPAAAGEVRVDTQTHRLNGDGALHLALPAGKHALHIGSQHWSFQTVAGEKLRLIANRYDDARPARLDRLSSARKPHNPGSTQAVPQSAAQGKPAILFGRVISAADGKPLAGVHIFISGTTKELLTDAQGRYRIELPHGEYAISLLHPRYATQTTGQLELGAGVRTEKNFQLSPAGVELEEFVVLQPHIEGSLAAVLDERKNAASVSDILGAEQIAASGDSDAAGALKRVTGLTLVDGRFIYVRGMGERYSSTLLNGAVIPGPDPTRRVIPLDLFPTAIIQSLSVQKSFSANMPGEFGGGTVDLRTRGVPDQDFYYLSLKTGFNTLTTGESGAFALAGARDWTGFDNSHRAMPGEVADALADTRLQEATRFNPVGFSPEEIQQLGRQLNPDWGLQNRTLPPDLGLGLALGKHWESGHWASGFRLGAGYSQQWDHSDEIRREYAASLDDNEAIQLTLRKDNRVQDNQRSIREHAFVAAGANSELGWAMNYTGLYLRQTTDEARITQGNNRSLGSESEIRRTFLLWEEEDLLAHQLTSTLPLVALQPGHEERFPRLEWQYTRARARRLAPGEREYRYDDIDGTGEFGLSTFGDSNALRFSTLRDDTEDAQATLRLPFALGPLDQGELSFGLRYTRRTRDAAIRRFKYLLGRQGLRELDLNQELDNLLTDDTIAPGYFTLSENTQTSDAYTASQRIQTRFAELDFRLWKHWRATLGLRIENNFQRVTNQPRFIDNAQAVEARLNTRDRLPAAALTWSLRDNMQLRASYGKTLARPDFRELSDTPFRDPVTDVDTIGNPNLQPTSIRNLDLRWEWYPTGFSNLSLAWFSKRFDQPIETILLPGENLLLTLANADSADNRGVELEGRTGLEPLKRWAPAAWHGLLEKTTLSVNVALIDSQIHLAAGTAQAQTNQSRPLQGQSPWTANVQLLYDDEAAHRHFSLVYNSYGERITSVGVAGKPDIYEQPFHQLDFIWRQQWGDWLLKMKLGNLLDPAVDTLQGPAITRSYHKGRSLSATLRYSF